MITTCFLLLDEYTELEPIHLGKYNMFNAIDKLVESLNKINPFGLVTLALIVVLVALLKG